MLWKHNVVCFTLNYLLKDLDYVYFITHLKNTHLKNITHLKLYTFKKYHHIRSVR